MEISFFSGKYYKESIMIKFCVFTRLKLKSFLLVEYNVNKPQEDHSKITIILKLGLKFSKYYIRKYVG